MSKAISRRDFLKVTGAVGAAGLRGRHGEDCALRHQGHRDRAGHGKRDAVGRHAGM